MRIYDNVAAAWEEIEDALGSLAKPALIIIAGPTCSGKSTLAGRMARLAPAALVELDNYFRDQDDLQLPRDGSGKIIFDLPTSYLIEEYIGQIRALLAGKVIRMPRYDKSSNRRLMETQAVASCPIIITEGLFSICLLNNVHPSCLRIYLDVNLDICLARRIERDSKTFKVSAEKVRNIFNQRVKPYIEEFVLPQKQLADLVIVG